MTPVDNAPNTNLTDYWQYNSTLYPQFDLTYAQAQAGMNKLLTGLQNAAQMDAVTDPYPVNMLAIGENVGDHNGAISEGSKLKITARAAALFGGSVRAMRRFFGQPSMAAVSFTFFFSVMNPDGTSIDINLGQALQTPDFALVPSGEQWQGGGYLKGTCPVTVLNAPVYPPLPVPPAGS